MDWVNVATDSQQIEEKLNCTKVTKLTIKFVDYANEHIHPYIHTSMCGVYYIYMKPSYVSQFCSSGWFSRFVRLLIRCQFICLFLMYCRVRLASWCYPIFVDLSCDTHWTTTKINRTSASEFQNRKNKTKQENDFERYIQCNFVTPFTHPHWFCVHTLCLLVYCFCWRFEHHTHTHNIITPQSQQQLQQQQ